MINMKQACEILNVTPTTLRNWEKSGKITSYKTTGNHRRYNIEDINELLGINKSKKDKLIIGYCRVSTNEQQVELERQKYLIENYCVAKGYTYKIITDIGSGINYNKKGLIELITLINNKEISKIVINYKDRLIRFGYEIIEQLCELNNIQIEIINHTDDKTYEEELVDDVLSILTVYSSKLYGSRSHKHKKQLDDIKNKLDK
jgi:excisionase family DNA binding protein